jgi:hypothetical protein
MKKFLVMIVIIAPFVYAYYHKPPFTKHQEKIFLVAHEADTAIDEGMYALPEWEGLDFSDWFIFTATRDKKLYTMVSFGLVDHVFVVDPDWARDVWKLKPIQKT